MIVGSDVGSNDGDEGTLVDATLGKEARRRCWCCRYNDR